MQKNLLRPIASKRVYEETYSIDQSIFNSHYYNSSNKSNNSNKSSKSSKTNKSNDKSDPNINNITDSKKFFFLLYFYPIFKFIIVLLIKDILIY
jgi:hypothetical protein